MDNVPPVDAPNDRSIVAQLADILRGDAGLPDGRSHVRVIGIDLGTTNSTVAEIAATGGEPPALRLVEVQQPTHEGDYTSTLVPSCVALPGSDIYIGEGAKRMRGRIEDLKLRANESLFFDCKNDIGIKKTYHRAPEGFRSAAEIGGHVLRFLTAAVGAEPELPVARTVITVPASFQSAQREDTRHAAQLAGINLDDGDLLDEPTAALLAHLTAQRAEAPVKTPTGTVLVFDFGGGTCDIAVFAMRNDELAGPLDISPLSVSRYHRLGGGDIDAVIAHDVLLPQLCAQNDLEPSSIGFRTKSQVLLPPLMGLAENLKILLCREIDRLARLEAFDDENEADISRSLPGTYRCGTIDRELQITSPRLTAEDLRSVLEPFLDRDLLYARDTEYSLTCSIFAPIQDALERADLDRESIDMCLMVGGSSLIPHVEWAIRDFFPRATVYRSRDIETVQAAVARGAAIHALALELYGRPVIRPVSNAAISIRTSAGLETLIPNGSALPYPDEGDFVRRRVAVPESSDDLPVDLRLEIVSGDSDGAQLQSSRIWPIEAPCRKGEPLEVAAQYDSNQVLHIEVRRLKSRSNAPLQYSIENPISHVVNPMVERLRIDELEEEMRTNAIPRDQMPDVMTEIADLSVKIGHREKALEFYSAILRQRNGADVGILQKMANVCGETGDLDRQEKLYLEAERHTEWNGPTFNLALLLRRRRRYVEALAAINRAIEKEPGGPEYTLRALIQTDMENSSSAASSLDEAADAFGALRDLDDWELGWRITAARMSGDGDTVVRAEKEQKRRGRKPQQRADSGNLPDGADKVSETD